MTENPKFYRSIPVTAKAPKRVERARGHQQLTAKRISGRLQFDLVSRQRVHVGTGKLIPLEKLGLDTAQGLAKAFFRINDQLTIPGSTLKGTFRSLFEMFTASCVCKTTVRWHGQERDRYGECRYNARRRQEDLCPACLFFGAMGYQGQVRFDDAPLVVGQTILHHIPPQYKPEPDHDQRRYYPYDLEDRRDPT